MSLYICGHMHLETQVGALANQLNVCLLHWYASVLNKRFLTPFRDGIRYHRQLSVGDRGVLPTRPRNRRGYAVLAHTLGKMRSCATGEHSNIEIRIVVLKKIQLYR